MTKTATHIARHSARAVRHGQHPARARRFDHGKSSRVRPAVGYKLEVQRAPSRHNRLQLLRRGLDMDEAEASIVAAIYSTTEPLQGGYMTGQARTLPNSLEIELSASLRLVQKTWTISTTMHAWFLTSPPLRLGVPDFVARISPRR